MISSFTSHFSGFHANKVLMRTFNDDGNLRSEMVIREIIM